ncbi:transmembrane protein 260 isoform X3 [Clarias gariepinus]|uniref:transmembrane protein 260 isoform X3 n=1 Tax=Clarias gariepinus TaxID=13013 RepID=UPI00234D1EE3|nr:transmembrane protein 260 isoform X3 [Clarias gariepinus]
MRANTTCWTLTGATVACVLALYLQHVARAVAGGDSGELITAACELGVAHPPGYPLFTILAALAVRLLPATSPAHAVNVLCAVLGAMASGALCYTVCRMAGSGPGAVLAGGSFALSKLVWQWSIVAEVFSLNNLFVGLLFCLAACFHTVQTVHQKKKFALWGALCCGVSLCNQHTLVVYVLVIIPWALLQLYTYKGLGFSSIVSLGVCFLAGFLPYIYLPISSYLNKARWSWGDQTTLSGLLTHLLRAEYGTFSLAKSEGKVNLMKMLQAQFNHCVADLSVPVLVLAALAMLQALWNRCRAVVCLIAIMVSVYSVFFAWRANLDIENPLLLGVVERFWLQADAGVCVLAGVGLNWTVCLLERWLGLRPVWNAGAWLITAGLLSHTVHLNQRELDRSRNDVVERFAHELIFSFPESSLVLTRGDLPGNTLRYLHYCQGLRPDLSLIDQEMMTYSWYVPKLQQHLPGVKFPGRVWDPVETEQKNSFNIEQFMQQNIHFPPGSWERVANEEMWQARMKTAFFLFDLAERIEEGSQTHLYELSYSIYCKIVNAQVDYPANWDKNLALAAERLLRLGGGQHGLESLLNHSIHHFRRYIEREPTDPQNSAILSAITHLTKERERLRDSLRKTR